MADLTFVESTDEKKRKYQRLMIQKEDKDGAMNLITISVSSKYEDKADMPLRGVTKKVKYKAMYMFKGAQVGEWSDVFSITLT